MSTKPRLTTIDYIPPIGTRDIFSPSVFRRYLLSSAAVVLLVTILYFWMLAVQVHLNIWWFESLGLGDVYGRMWATQKDLFLIFGILSYIFFSVIFVAARAATYRPGPDLDAKTTDIVLSFVTGFAAMVAAMIVGATAADSWQTYLLAGHSQTVGVADPIHHLDVGFYLFTLPWRDVASTLIAAILLVGGAEMAALATIYTITSPYETVRTDLRRIASFGSLFGAVLFAFLAWRNLFLNPYDLTQPGTAFGGGATFANAGLWWYHVVAFAEILTAVVLLANTILRTTPLLFVALLPIVVGTASNAGQGIFQKFVVAPNELSAEYRYLGYNISYTRRAYDMTRWKVREYTPESLTSADLNRDRATVQDARITDLGAVTQVMRQRQENRTYYAFDTADIDRYPIGGQVRQVTLAARELGFWKLPGQAQTWVNEHIKFTHGYGLTMTPSNTVTPDGQPVFWVQNIPVQETVAGLPPVRQPRIYFGEYTNSWILVNATTTEFDSSQADQDTSYRYAGPDGIPIGGGTKRLSITWALEGGIPFFDKLNITGYVRPQTRILLHRNIFDRVQTIAPWLEIDSDPYLVLRSDGSLVWMMDGMTHADTYPYSEPTDGDNYRRNSVKIIVDAYTGKVSFYAFDQSDPVLRAWESVFPGLVQPLSHMPADLRAHIKYPASYLLWQARAYQRYHVTNITSFYNGDNEWDIESSESFNWGNDFPETTTLSPIWTVARLFGEKHDSFFSILPFSVRGKAPMAGYLAADNNTYRVTALDMPRGAQTMGARQFESLYNQAPTISSTLTLLDQHGSQVVPGQLLIVPVSKALLYIKPLYLSSNSGQSLPQLIRVVVGTQNAVNWGYTLQQAINNLLTQGDISNVSQSPSTQTTPTPRPTPQPLPSNAGQYEKMSTGQLIALANHYFTAAERTPSLTQKDQDLKQLGIILSVLRSRQGG